MVEDKRKLKILFDYLFAYWIYGLTIVGIHEFFHSNIARILGYTNMVKFYFFSGYTFIQQSITNPYHYFLIAVSGGLGVSILFLCMLYFLDWETDRPEIMAIRIHVYQQSTYSILETLYIFQYLSIDNLFNLTTISTIIIFTIQTFYFMRGIFK